MTARSAGAADEKPLDAAKAQANFDCWMEQQEENFQPQHIAACRDGYMTDMAELEAQPQMAMAPAPAPAMETAEPAGYTENFALDKAEPTPDARTMLDDVVMEAKTSSYPDITIGAS